MRKALVLLIVAIAGGGGWYFGKHGGPNGLDDLKLFSSGSATQTNHDPRPPVSRSSDTIRIASFNIQVFGTSKLKKPHVMDILARIVREFDVVAVQEVRSRDESVVPQFVELINQTGRHYDYAIGPRLGNSSSKEQYVFIFDTASIELDRHQLYTVDDPDNLLHREPYVGWFRVRGPSPDKAFTFTLVNIHTDPDEVNEEIKWMDNIYREVRDDGRGEDDVIILGDFNVNDRNLGELAQVPGMTWVVSGVPTNTRGTAQYDNIVFNQQATREFTGQGGVFDFLRKYSMTMEQALEVSDHLPVWAEFSIYEGGTPGHVAKRNGRGRR